MPIRFRCAYCNQLLGIARRKAGTVIHCPTCAGQVVVPAAESEEPAPAGRDEPVFERSDFEQMINPKPGRPRSRPPAPVNGPSAPPPAAPPDAWGTHGEAPIDVDRLPPGTAPSSVTGAGPVILLTPAKATLLTVLVVVFVALAFGVGFFVGRASM